ncbi:MAG TPA: hypothetical protein VLV90_13390 [Burkholderiales bacterium]|nr:hypothetical protein [Burkholderiales bacterium]
MDFARKDPSPEQAPVALIVLTAIVYVAGIAMVVAWFALVVLGPPAPSNARADAAAPACSVCGVVQRVTEFERASLQLSGEQTEGFVVLLAQLGGLKDAPAQARVYETAVLQDDGTVRVVRDSSAPQWKRGDRVKVVRGRVELVALAQP